MADRILKPDTGNDLVLQNDDASAKIEINEDGTNVVSSKLKINAGTTNNANTETDGIEIANNAGTSPAHVGIKFDQDSSSGDFEGFVRAVRTAGTTFIGLEIGTISSHGIRFLTSGGTDSDVAIEINASGNLIVKSGSKIDISSGATLDTTSGTLTTSTAQKQAISATAFASGTKMLFNQTSAPTGWTKDTSSNNNSALRVVTGSAGTGGSQDFTSAFGATISVSTAVDNHTLAKTELPAHFHYIQTINTAGAPYGGAMAGGNVSGSYTSDGNTKNTGDFSAGGHNHNTTMSGTGSSASTHNLSVKYVDVIIATKD